MDWWNKEHPAQACSTRGFSISRVKMGTGASLSYCWRLRGQKFHKSIRQRTWGCPHLWRLILLKDSQNPEKLCTQGTSLKSYTEGLWNLAGLLSLFITNVSIPQETERIRADGMGEPNNHIFSLQGSGHQEHVFHVLLTSARQCIITFPHIQFYRSIELVVKESWKSDLQIILHILLLKGCSCYMSL